MTLGTQIALYRKQQAITQDALAQKLGVTNQAVSKWESDQCCPDILLLPKLADVFGISLDALFGREHITDAVSLPLSWEDNGDLHVVLFAGHQLVKEHPICKNVTIQYSGPAKNIDCAFSLTCDDVGGDVHAGGSVTCDCVGGSINAGGNVTCDVVGSDVKAGGNVTCEDEGGDVTAGCDVTCEDIGGSVCAGRSVRTD